MSFENAKKYLTEKGFENRILVFDVSSATVDDASKAVGVESCQIAKSLTFLIDEKPIMIVCAGDKKIDNQKYKAQFLTKAKMIAFDDVEILVGHAVGGVCPFGIKQNINVYLDISLRQFDFVYPACGDSRSAVKLSPAEFEAVINLKSWVDVCK